MCVRLSPSHPAARIVVGLYIFLATFLIGFFVVQCARSNLFNHTATGHEEAIGSHINPDNDTALGTVESHGPKGCSNVDGILISRSHYVPLSELPSFTTIRVTNNGSQTVQPGTLYVDSWASGAGVNEYSRIYAERTGDGVEINNVQDPKPIEHLQAHRFILPVTGDDRLVVTFDYKLGDDEAFHQMHVFIPRGLQFPVRCF